MTDEHVIAAMEHYGVGPHDFVRAMTCPQSLEKFQGSIKARFRELARTFHPDKGGDADLFKTLSAVADEVSKMAVRERAIRGFERPTRRVKWAVHFQMETA